MNGTKYANYVPMTKKELIDFADSIADQPKSCSIVSLTEYPSWYDDTAIDDNFRADFIGRIGEEAIVLGPDLDDPDCFIIEFDDGTTFSVYTEIVKIIAE